jgi:hypothetical protein
VKPDFPIAIAALVVILSIVAGEVRYVSGTFATAVSVACVVSAFLFSMARGPRGRVMAGHGRTVSDDEYGGGDGVERRLSRLTEEERKEIVKEVFDMIYVEIGRSIVKKAILVILSAALVLVVWLTKNHLEIK